MVEDAQTLGLEHKLLITTPPTSVRDINEPVKKEDIPTYFNAVMNYKEELKNNVYHRFKEINNVYPNWPLNKEGFKQGMFSEFIEQHPYWPKAKYIKKLLKTLEQSILLKRINKSFKILNDNLEIVLKTIGTINICECNNICNEQGICRHCGLVGKDFEKEFSNQEKRVFTKYQIQERKMTEPVWRPFGPRTFFPEEKDAYNKKLPRSKISLFNRLRKIQSSLTNTLERNYWEALPKISSMKKYYSKPIINTAWSIYSECAKKGLTKGRSIVEFIGASLYSAIRIHGEPELMFEVFSKLVKKITDITKRRLLQSLNIIVKERVLKNLEEELNKKGINVDYSFKNVKYIDYLNRYASKIGIPPNMITTMADLVKPLPDEAKPLLDENGYVRSGIDPAGIIAANLYKGLKILEKIISEELKEDILKKLNYEVRKQHPDIKSDFEIFSEKAIGHYMEVTEVTLRSRKKEM